jgi:hypothetical protein
MSTRRAGPEMAGRISKKIATFCRKKLCTIAQDGGNDAVAHVCNSGQL